MTAATRQVRAVLAEDSPDYAVSIDAAGHPLAADEPRGNGGQGSGPGPRELIVSGLCACTAITLRMYAQRKGWAIGTLEVVVRVVADRDNTTFDRQITASGALDAAQKARLAEISERTPMTLLLKYGVTINTTLR